MILRESSELQSLEGAASNSTASEVGHSKVILSDFLQDGGAELVRGCENQYFQHIISCSICEKLDTCSLEGSKSPAKAERVFFTVSN